jgi:hypothetical protein
MGLFNKNNPPEQAGMINNILSSLLAQYGVTQEHINKVKNVLDLVDISEKEITVKLGGVKIVINR